MQEVCNIEVLTLIPNYRLASDRRTDRGKKIRLSTAIYIGVRANAIKMFLSPLTDGVK